MKTLFDIIVDVLEKQQNSNLASETARETIADTILSEYYTETNEINTYVEGPDFELKEDGSLNAVGTITDGPGNIEGWTIDQYVVADKNEQLDLFQV